MALFVICLALWFVLMNVFKRTNMHFFRFILGSVGLFVFLMYAGSNTIEKALEYILTYCMGVVGSISGLFDAIAGYSSITVYHNTEVLSFFVDYECSGYVELVVYICLLTFYPIYSVFEKSRLMVWGTLYIFAANIVRILVICLIGRYFGRELFFFSHTVFARIIFFMLMIVLYHITFTRPHIIRQKVGNLTYEG